MLKFILTSEHKFIFEVALTLGRIDIGTFHGEYCLVDLFFFSMMLEGKPSRPEGSLLTKRGGPSMVPLAAQKKESQVQLN